MKLANFMHSLYRVGQHNSKIIFFFLTLDRVLSDSNSEISSTCDKLNETELIRSMKFENL